MKYVIRAIKYFFQVSLLLCAVLAVLVLVGAISPDIGTMFSHGWKSVGWIALMFAGVSAVYPLFGYAARDVVIPGEYSGIRGGIVSCMEAHRYVLESEVGENMTFRLRSGMSRLMRLFEDRITLTRSLGGFVIEGLNKDVVRLKYGLESALRAEQQDQ